jgi:predicted glycogen debranching enzyme
LLPGRIEQQRLYAKTLEVVAALQGIKHIENFDLEQAARQLQENPFDFCRRHQPHGRQPHVIVWRWPQDLRREVMIPPAHFLLIRSESAFRACIMDGDRAVATEVSLPGAAGNPEHFALFSPLATPGTLKTVTLGLSVYASADSDRCRHEVARLRLLPRPADVRVKQIIKHAELLQEDFTFLGTNGRGAMVHTPVSWGNLTSRYDGLLAANLNPLYPEDRWVMFSRCRAWVVFQGYSQALNTDCLEMFHLAADSSGIWQYHIPTGQGEHVRITARVEMLSNRNAVALSFHRHPADRLPDRLADSKPVTIILRPDIENRSFHAATKAYLGPEHQWPDAVTAFSNGFHFAPDAEHHLRVQISAGSFIREPEWLYMVNRPKDARRGHDPDSDLFSPGYLSAAVEGNQTLILQADAGRESEISPEEIAPPHPINLAAPEERETGAETFTRILKASLDHYVVRRGDLKTVIAGYPWFLDWGRDALIFARGLAAAGKIADARDIIAQFARFEEQGTLPNMIQAENAANRDTSDAPLWLITACADLMRAEGHQPFMDSDCGGRSLRQILLSIGRSITAGTPNGVRMDPESGLIFSPTHFSWMDTNHPAGTPRQGYPIEIQALWHSALRFLSKIDSANAADRWQRLARQVSTAIVKYYWQPDSGYLSDCLHADSGQPARDAAADDALRPNQLFAITLGAIKAPQNCEQILAACQELLVPGAIRSLADRPVRHPIEIHHHGKLINDPHHPYQGRYEGDEDTRRKPAYHNGTAWTWLFPSFAEAWAMTYGQEGTETALSWLTAGAPLVEHGCLGHIPEILDGDYPHTARGCDAQAWGVSELLRVWLKLAN